jgi:hypothetical protein
MQLTTRGAVWERETPGGSCTGRTPRGNGSGGTLRTDRTPAHGETLHRVVTLGGAMAALEGFF